MKLTTSDKTSSFGKRPLIKKGYYPAQLLAIKPYTDADGNLKEGKYGNQLIFEFQIYNQGADGKPTTMMMFDDDGEEKPVLIGKFVYHQYKDQKTGTMGSAITKKSAITRLLETLDWTFEPKVELDMGKFLDRWVEVNVDDYTPADGETSSSIQGINHYTGPAITEQPITKPSKEQEVVETVEQVQEQVVKLNALKDAGTLTGEGYITAMEQLQAKLDNFK